MEEAEVAEIRDGEVSALDGDDDLDELHRLRPEQIHWGTASSHSLSLSLPQSGFFRSVPSFVYKFTNSEKPKHRSNEDESVLVV